LRAQIKKRHKIPAFPILCGQPIFKILSFASIFKGFKQRSGPYLCQPPQDLEILSGAIMTMAGIFRKSFCGKDFFQS